MLADLWIIFAVCNFRARKITIPLMDQSTVRIEILDTIAIETMLVGRSSSPSLGGSKRDGISLEISAGAEDG